MTKRSFGQRFLAAASLAVALLGIAPLAQADTWSTPAGDTSSTPASHRCSQCHGISSTNGNTPPRLPSQGSSILDSSSVNYSQSCSGGACSLRSLILSNGNMGSSVANAFSASELEGVRQYLVQVREGTFTNGLPSFDPATIGVPSTATFSTFTITMRNYRNDTVAYALSITGADAADFTLMSWSPGSGCSSTVINSTSTTAPVACTVTVNVRFRPASGTVRTRNASLSVDLTSNDSGDLSPVDRSVTLSASAIAPVSGFNLLTPTLNLSARANSTERDTGTVTVQNPSSATANLVINSVSFSANRFKCDSGSNGPGQCIVTGGTCAIGGAGIVPGGQCTIVVQYAADGTTGQSGTMTISHNSPSPLTGNTVTLNATGTVSTIDPTSGVITFGDVQTGVATPSPSQTIRNLGNATLTFRAPNIGLGELPTISGPGAGQFSVSGCTGTLAVAPSSCNFTVTFTPTAPSSGDTEPRNAVLTFYSDATNNGGKATFTLTGNSVTLPPPTVTTLPLSDFPDTVINENSAQTRIVTLTNPRTRDVTFSVVDLADFLVIGNTCPNSAKAGSTSSGRVTGGGTTCTLTLRFRPAVAGGATRRTGSFSVAFAGTGGDPSPAAISVAVAGTAKLPLKLSATSLTPAAVVGSPTPWTVTLTNEASTPITLSSLVYSGAQAADYALAPTSVCVNGYVLAASASCDLITRFAPSTAVPAARNATLTITHTGVAGSPQTVTLNGTATPAPQGRIELSGTSLTFPDTQLASTSPITVTLSNAGNLALNFTSFTIGGANAADYTRSGTCAVGTTVPYVVGGPPASCTVVLTFAPGALGTRTGNLAIRSDATNDPVTITMTGTGIPIPVPVVTLNPTALNFGDQTIGGLYPARRVRLSNTGTADLAVASIAVTGTGYRIVSSACPSTLAVGTGCDIDLLLAATESRLYSGTLTITDNAAGSPHTVALTGMGVAAAVPVLTWSPMVTTLDFGTVSAGSVSATQTVTVLNQGPGGATLTLLNATGPDASAFSVTGGTCNLTTPLFEGASCTVNIVFTPGSAGAKTAQVQVASTGSFPTTLTLTGVGMAGPNPAFSVSASSLNLGTVRVGAQSMPQVVRLTSGGDGAVMVTAMTTDGPFTIFSTTCPALPFSLASGSECTVSVAYNAAGEGSATGTLRITTDAAPSIREVALTGSGIGNPDTTSGGGGCTIGGGNAPLDPTLWLLLLAAIGVLLERERRRRAVIRQIRIAARLTTDAREVTR